MVIDFNDDLFAHKYKSGGIKICGVTLEFGDIWSLLSFIKVLEFIYMVIGFNDFKYFSRVLIKHEVCSVLVLCPMHFKTKSLKSGGEEFDKNSSIHSFVKSNLNGIYLDLRLGLRMKITFLLSDFFAYCSIKLSFL